MTGKGNRSLRTAFLGAASALVVLAGLSAPAAAQNATAAVAVTPPMPQAFADEVEIRIAELHIALSVTPAQEPLFRAYAETMRGNAQATHALFLARVHATDFSAPARLRWRAELAAAHAEAINRLIAPFDALYQSLSGPQKAAADRYFEALAVRVGPWQRRWHRP